MKKNPQGIILLHMYTIMMIIWCMVPETRGATDRIFCHLYHFLPFTSLPPATLAPIPLTTRKIKILKKWKKHLMILSFCTCVTKMRIIWHMVPEMRSMTDSIFCHFGPFFALLPHYQPEKSKFWKNEKKTWRYHFTHAYQKSWSHTMLFLRYGTWWM